LEAHRRATAKVKANALKTLGKPRRDRTILSAIKNKQVLRFKYNGKERIVEPQTYGISIAGREVLRARQVGGESGSGQLRMAKLFDLKKISQLRKAGTAFAASLPAHNPSIQRNGGSLRYPSKADEMISNSVSKAALRALRLDLAA